MVLVGNTSIVSLLFNKDIELHGILVDWGYLQGFSKVYCPSLLTMAMRRVI